MNSLQKKEYFQGLVDEEVNRLDYLYNKYIVECDKSVKRISNLENKLIKEQAYE